MRNHGRLSHRRAQRLRVNIAPTVQAPSIARGVLRELGTEGELESAELSTALLLVSELVSNAVQHSGAPSDADIVLALDLGRSRLRVEVIDGGGGFAPRPRNPAQALGGYGLFLMEKAASRWGVDRRGGCRVWFELNRRSAGHPRRPAAAPGH